MCILALATYAASRSSLSDFLGSEDTSHTHQQLSTSAAAHSVCSLHHISIIIDALLSYLKILCPNVHRCVHRCDSNEKPVVARNMNPGLLASAISTLLLMHNHWTTASRHSLARLFRHVTEEMCHLDSMYSFVSVQLVLRIVVGQSTKY